VFLLRIAMSGGFKVFHILALAFKLSDDLACSHRGR